MTKPLKRFSLLSECFVVLLLVATFPREVVADGPDAKQSDAIFSAVKNGDLATLKQLIGNGAVDVKDATGATPLFDAASSGNATILSWLIEKGANVNSAMTNGATALFFAVSAKQEESCKLLLHSGAKVNVVVPIGKNFPATPLFLAMNRQAESIILLLIESGADVNASFGNGTFPHYPLEYGMWIDWTGKNDVLKALLTKGAKSPWLSRIKEFDPYTFDYLSPEKNGNGRIMVGSLPLFLGAYTAHRPWHFPRESERSTTGKNFWRWQNPLKDSGPLTTMVITDERGNRTELQLVPMIYIGNAGIAYSENVADVERDGPFVDIIVEGSDSTVRVTAARGDGTKIELKRSGGSYRGTLRGVTDYEPITVTKYGDGDVQQSSTDFDCVYRSAKSGAVIYRVP
jgi:hypothetical protein